MPILIALSTGLALLRQGHYIEARAALEQAAAAQPQSAPALLDLAEIRLTEREPEQAEKLAEKAIALQPGSAHAHFLLGRVLVDEIDSVSIFSKLSYAKRMKAEFDKAAELDPDSAEAREALFHFYLEAPGIAGGSVDKARSLAAELVQIDRFRGLMAQAELFGHEGQDGSGPFEKAIAAASTPGERLAARAGYAYALLEAKKTPAAIAQFQALIHALPADARAQATAADGFLKSGDIDAALAAARKGVEIDAAVPPPHFFLAEALLKKGDKAGAKAEYQAYLRLAPPKAPRAQISRDRLKEL